MKKRSDPRREAAALRGGKPKSGAEKVSGKSIKDRPELENAIDEPGTGDVLMLAEWDRCTRSMFDGIHLIERIDDRGRID